MSASDAHKQIVLDIAFREIDRLAMLDYAYNHSLGFSPGSVADFKENIRKNLVTASGKPKFDRAFKKNVNGTVRRGFESFALRKTFFVTVEKNGVITEVEEWNNTAPNWAVNPGEDDLKNRSAIYPVNAVEAADGETKAQAVLATKKAPEDLPMVRTIDGDRKVIGYTSFANALDRQEERGKLGYKAPHYENVKRVFNCLDSVVAARGFRWVSSGLNKTENGVSGILLVNIQGEDCQFYVAVTTMGKREVPSLYLRSWHKHMSQIFGASLGIDDNTDQAQLERYFDQAKIAFTAFCGGVFTSLYDFEKPDSYALNTKPEPKTKTVKTETKPKKVEDPRRQYLMDAVMSNKYALLQFYHSYPSSMYSYDTLIMTMMGEIRSPKGKPLGKTFSKIWERAEADGSMSFAYSGGPWLGNMYVVREKDDVIQRIEMWTHDFAFDTTTNSHDLNRRGDVNTDLMHIYVATKVGNGYTFQGDPEALWDRRFWKRK